MGLNFEGGEASCEDKLRKTGNVKAERFGHRWRVRSWNTERL